MAHLSPVDKRLATDISFIEPHINGVEKNGRRMPLLQNDLQIIEFEELIADGIAWRGIAGSPVGCRQIF